MQPQIFSNFRFVFICLNNIEITRPFWFLKINQVVHDNFCEIYLIGICKTKNYVAPEGGYTEDPNKKVSFRDQL